MLFLFSAFAFSKPVATTATNSAPWPTPKATAQTWPTPGRTWPPTMSPWPTRDSRRTDSSIDGLSPVAIVAISVGAVLLLGIVFALILIRMRKRKVKVLASIDEATLLGSSNSENRKFM